MVRRRLLLLSVLLAVPGLAPPADDPEGEKLRAAESQAMCSKRTRDYAFRPTGGGPAFTLRAEPILKWTQPVYGTVYGYVYVWTSGGRPEVVGSFLKWYQPFKHVTDEFHSLATVGIVGENEGRAAWTSERPGVDLKPIPEAPDPASTPAGRLRQMRDMAREFAGRENDRGREDRDLRLLTQPVYRYETPEGELVDGALFVLAHGTDPDAFLVIEARRVDGAARWQYALARMTTSALRVNYRGKEVWNVPLVDYNLVYGHREPYTSFRFDDEKATPPERPSKP